MYVPSGGMGFLLFWEYTNSVTGDFYVEPLESNIAAFILMWQLKYDKYLYLVEQHKLYT